MTDEDEFPLTEAQAKLGELAQHLEICALAMAARVAQPSANLSDPPVLSTLLLLRATGHFQALLLLTNEGFVTEVRTLTRSLVEVALFAGYLEADPSGFLAAFEADAAAAKIGQAKALMKDTRLFASVAPESRRALNDFIKSASENKAKGIDLAAVAQKSSVGSLYLAYRVLSGDAGHVSLLSLQRHLIVDAASGEAQLDPGRDDIDEIYASLDIAVRAFMVVCTAHSTISGDREGNRELAGLEVRLRSLPPMVL